MAVVAVAAVAYERWYGTEQVRFASGEQITVVDGDTLRAKGMDYRLRGIDAPELAQSCLDERGRNWTCGREARARLRSLLAGGSVECSVYGRDRFGRALADCRAEGVPDVGEALVREGLALDFDRRGGRYAAAEQAAQAGKKGIWRGSFEEPSQWRAAHPRNGRWHE